MAKPKGLISTIIMIAAVVIILLAFLSIITQPAPKGAGLKKVVTISVTESGFKPASLTVTRGTVVEWENQDDPEAVITSGTYGDSQQGAKPLFMSPQLTEDGTFKYEFNQAGTFSYHNKLKPAQAGVVEVK
jgi:plastocyanin